jgi:hypothetical protein
MSYTQEHPTAPGRRPRRHSRARVAAPAVAAVLAASISAGLATAQTSSTTPGAGGTSAARTEPPTAADVRAWEAEAAAGEPAAKAVRVPRAAGMAPGGPLFPQNEVLSLYGAAGGFGVLGRKSVNGAARKLKKQIRPYRRRLNKPVVKAFDLVAVIATQCSGPNGECRIRVSKDTIRRYLRKARDIDARLILDIQPGRANVLDEMRHLGDFINEPDVDVALDAEWNVGPNGEPGEDLGHLSAGKINKATARLKKVIRARDLPPKLLIIHQFREDSVRGERRINRPSDVDVTLNFDGIGSPSAKRDGYKALSFRGLFNGFSLFYRLDQNLMSPAQVVGLNPRPDYIMYQ